MNTPKKTFKRITIETETTDIALSSVLVEKLDGLAETLSLELGLDVTIAGAVGYLLRQYEQRSPTVDRLTAAHTDAVKIARIMTQQVTSEQKQAVDSAIRLFMARSDKIGAIRYLRSETGLGLKESKDYVESLVP